MLRRTLNIFKHLPDPSQKSAGSRLQSVAILPLYCESSGPPGIGKAVDTVLQEGAQAVEELRVATPGGRFQVRWDEGGSASALGQLAFFAEFLEVSGLFTRWVDGCPMGYTSPNAPAVADVLGTWLLSVLDGQRRYAHVAGLRGDEVAPQILKEKGTDLFFTMKNDDAAK